MLGSVSFLVARIVFSSECLTVALPAFLGYLAKFLCRVYILPLNFAYFCTKATLVLPERQCFVDLEPLQLCSVKRAETFSSNNQPSKKRVFVLQLC